jgi:hypothetical protein
MTIPPIVCITHGEDADGITCAALIKRLKGAYPILVAYDDLEKALVGVRPGTKELYVCDLNIRDSLVDQLVRISDFSEVTVIDHHPITEEALKRLRKAGIEVIHDTRDCASVLLYNHFIESFNRLAGRMAAFAAWADQFEDGPLAEELLREYDRQSVQHEGLILAHALTKNPQETFREKVMEEISRLEFPHRIQGVPEAAHAYLEDIARFIEILPGMTHHLGVLAYAEATEEMPIGSVAGLITDALDVEVGLCYRVGPERVNVSIRSRRGITYHLGEITRRIAYGHGGFGGGHKRASGASIPIGQIQEFITDLDKEISAARI